jgi:hypothetical protein
LRHIARGVGNSIHRISLIVTSGFITRGIGAAKSGVAFIILAGFIAE